MLPGHYDDAPPHPRGRHRARRRPPLQSQQKVVSPQPSRNTSREPLYRTTSLETRSRTPSPHTVTSPTDSQLEYYGSVNLTDRSRSPSPDTARRMKMANKSRGGGTRRLPAIPHKPDTLNLPKKHLDAGSMPQILPSPTLTKSASNINFPKLSASPTHRPRMPHPSRGRRERSMSPRRRRPYSPTDAQDLADAGMYAPRDRAGRSDRLYSSQMLNNSSAADYRCTPPRDNRHGDDIQVVHVAGRQVPSGLPNGYKPGQVAGRTPDLHLRKQVQPAPPPDEQSDSEDEDWC